MSMIYADKVLPYLERHKEASGWVELSRISIQHLETEQKDTEKYISWLEQQDDDPKQSIKLYKARLKQENNEKLSSSLALMANELVHLHNCLGDAHQHLTKQSNQLKNALLDLNTFKQLYQSEHELGLMISKILTKRLPEPTISQTKKSLKNNWKFWQQIEHLFKGDLKL